mmetsp:Transcript_91179/g.181819  ORF Transcript_91179/g.181819 Transcript_91179/m.181819 type:complete len:245 (-) Transcript_91179:364-1098(-)
MPPRCAPFMSSAGAPRASISWLMSIIIPVIRFLISGRQSRMWCINIWFSILESVGVLQRLSMLRYSEWDLKNCCSLFSAAATLVLLSTSRCPRLTTPTYPRRRGITRFCSISEASVPGSMRSSLVSTPIVRSPSGSASCASFRASLLAKSELPAVTARMMAFGFEMNPIHMLRICSSISSGWSPTETLVIPGRSTKVRLSTFGEVILKFIGFLEIPLLRPVALSVSRTISASISLKSVNFCPGM